MKFGSSVAARSKAAFDRWNVCSPHTKAITPTMTVGYEDVRRFEVTMDDALGMRSIERIGNLDTQ
jgi:hypothetical protein